MKREDGWAVRGEGIELNALRSDMDFKVGAALRIVQLALPHMREQRRGRVINVVSVAGKAPSAGSAPTALARAGRLGDDLDHGRGAGSAWHPGQCIMRRTDLVGTMEAVSRR